MSSQLSHIDLQEGQASSQHPQAATNYKDFFQLFDRRGRGQCEQKCLGDLLRSCGQNPSLKEVKELEGQVGGDFDFDTFSKILNRPGGFSEPGPPEDYCKGFQVFDKDLTGYVGVGQFRYLMTHLGEPMSDEEVDNVLKHIDTPNDEINYLDFVKKILSG
ncbi:MAG: hypothetical protein M1828_001229 [Chrysothrix sp. TS-e1954]|nr:MAG: hypothetical protein M1828_001229 [Chrysothrix sp. TS-e1954]